MIFSSAFFTIFFYWNIFLTALVMVAPLQMPAYAFFIGVISAWFLFFIITAGYLSGKNKEGQYSYLLLAQDQTRGFQYKYKFFVFVLGLSFALSQYAMNFYTGQTIFSLLENIMSGNSLYALYQAYFKEEGLKAFSLAKVPAILSLISLKAIILWCFYKYFFLPQKIRRIYFVVLALTCLNYLVFSFARGTNFEVFEMFFLALFTLLLRVRFKKSALSLRPVLIVLFFVVLISNLYLYNIFARYGDADVRVCSSSLICLDTNSTLYKHFPTLAMFLYMMSGYFVFGLGYISFFVESFLYDRGFLSVMALFPQSFELMGFDIARESICGVYIDCSASWTPSLIVWLNSLGGLICLFVIFVLGWLVRIVESVFVQNGFLAFVLLFYLTLLVVSLPVGNFVFTSSANSVLFLTVLLLFVGRKIRGDIVKL